MGTYSGKGYVPFCINGDKNGKTDNSYFSPKSGGIYFKKRRSDQWRHNGGRQGSNAERKSFAQKNPETDGKYLSGRGSAKKRK